VPADQGTRGNDQSKAREAVIRQQPAQQGEPGTVGPGEFAVQVAWRRAALGDGQLVAQDENLDVLGSRILA